MDDVLNRLKRLKTEDFIWITYFFIAAFAIFSNAFEREYVLTNNTKAFKKSKTINIALFFIAFFIYLYFVLLFTSELNNIERNFNSTRYRNTLLQLIASLLFLIGGAIYLVQEVISSNVEEIGFIP